MHSKKLGRAAAAAGLMALLLPSAAFASWWDGGYDGRYDSSYDGRRGDSAPPRDEQPPGSDRASDYEAPGETPPPDDAPPPQECGPSGCARYTPPPDNSPPSQCGPQGCERYTPPPQQCERTDCDAPPPPDCGQPDCNAPAPPDCGQPDCGATSPPQECGPSGCTRYTPPPDNSPPSQCGSQGCERYTPPPQQCERTDCDAPPPPGCGQPDCDAPPPPCGQPACAQGPPPPPPPLPPPPPFYEPIYGCENSTLSDVQFSLLKTTSPPPGTPVRPGDEILVDITWDWWNFIGPDLHKAIDCVYINGLFVPELSGGERPTPNDGHFGFHYFVPLDVPPGSEICDQGFVSGPQGWEEYGRTVSNVVCFPVVAPPPAAAAASVDLLYGAAGRRGDAASAARRVRRHGVGPHRSGGGTACGTA